LQSSSADKPEGVVVSAGPNGGKNLVGLGGRKNELEMRWWFFNQFQQRIGRIVRQLMRFIDDVDAVCTQGWGVHGLLTKVTRVFHTTVACGIHFDDIDTSGAVRRQVDA